MRTTMLCASTSMASSSLSRCRAMATCHARLTASPRSTAPPVLRGDCRTSASSEAAASVDLKQKWWEKDTAPNMKDVGTVQQLVDELADAGDKLVVVEFYAPWCNACKALYPKVCKIMNDHLDDVVFLKVSFEDNKDMCKTLGVKVLPFFQFFRGAEGKVTQFSCSISKIQKLKDAVMEYSGLAICSLEEPPGLNEFPDIHPSGEHHHPDADKITTLAWN